jgi:hypothetical protein
LLSSRVCIHNELPPIPQGHCRAQWASNSRNVQQRPPTVNQGKVMDDEGIGKKNFRPCGTSIQEITAKQVLLGIIAVIPFGRSNSYQKNCSRDIDRSRRNSKNGFF